MAVSNFISRLNRNSFVSVITFDTHVELQIDLTQDHTATRKAVESISVDVAQNGSCLADALYEGIRETARAPSEAHTKNILVLFTDFSPGENIGNCSAHSLKDVRTLKAEHPVSTFIVQVGGQDSVHLVEEVTSDMGGRFFSTRDESEISNALLVLAEERAVALGTRNASAETLAARPEPRMLVPAGEFIMGNHQVYLDDFWIDKTEVTNAMYAKCVEWGTCSTPHSYRSKTRDSYYGNPLFDHYPVIFVSWMDADKYCFWAGGRLPTEAEWEKAARGTDGRSFPWGEADPSLSIRYLNYHSQDTTQVGSYPDGDSPYGVLDMAGNVGEWVADWFSVDSYEHPLASNPLGPASGQYRVWRGGSWANTSNDWLYTFSRTGNPPTDYSSGLGFRCARDATP